MDAFDNFLNNIVNSQVDPDLKKDTVDDAWLDMMTQNPDYMKWVNAIDAAIMEFCDNNTTPSNAAFVRGGRCFNGINGAKIPVLEIHKHVKNNDKELAGVLIRFMDGCVVMSFYMELELDDKIVRREVLFFSKQANQEPELSVFTNVLYFNQLFELAPINPIGNKSNAS